MGKGPSNSKLFQLCGFERHYETRAGLNPLSLLDNRRPPFDQMPGLVPELDVHPSLGEEERSQSGIKPCFAFKLVLRNPYVSRNNHPVAFARQRSYPIDIFSAG
jgi:hypothetical protein